MVGIRSIRTLTESERELLLAARGPLPSPAPPEIYWWNLYVDGVFVGEHPLRNAVDRLAHLLLAEVYAEPVQLLSYGFTVNPAGSTHHQPWHIDYSPTASSLLIALTPITPENGTRFLRDPLPTPPATDTYGDLPALFDAAGRDALEIAQVVCRPFVILQLLPGTVHAGIPNRADQDRVLFHINVDVVPRVLGERGLTVFTAYDRA